MNGKDKVVKFRVLYCVFQNPLKDEEEGIEGRSVREAKIRDHDLPLQNN